jgi:hypothetical protein
MFNGFHRMRQFMSFASDPEHGLHQEKQGDDTEESPIAPLAKDHRRGGFAAIE